MCAAHSQVLLCGTHSQQDVSTTILTLYFELHLGLVNISIYKKVNKCFKFCMLVSCNLLLGHCLKAFLVRIQLSFLFGWIPYQRLNISQPYQWGQDRFKPLPGAKAAGTRASTRGGSCGDLGFSQGQKGLHTQDFLFTKQIYFLFFQNRFT